MNFVYAFNPVAYSVLQKKNIIWRLICKNGLAYLVKKNK